MAVIAARQEPARFHRRGTPDAWRNTAEAPRILRIMRIQTPDGVVGARSWNVQPQALCRKRLATVGTEAEKPATVVPGGPSRKKKVLNATR
jgi:hypothetical protein